VENSNANENKQLTSPIIAQNAVYAANFAPLPAPFLKTIFNSVRTLRELASLAISDKSCEESLEFFML